LETTKVVQLAVDLAASSVVLKVVETVGEMAVEKDEKSVDDSV